MNRKSNHNQTNKEAKEYNILLKCLDCDKNFENIKSKRNLPSLIYSHLKETGHSHVEICKESQKAEIGDLICKYCEETNVFQLCIIQITNEDVTIVCDSCHKKKYIHLSASKVMTSLNAISRTLVDMIIDKFDINQHLENEPENLPVRNEPSIPEAGYIQCFTCKQSYSNSKPKRDEQNDIITHLNTPYHNSIKLNFADGSSLRPKCTECKRTNIFHLNLLTVDQHLLIMCNYCVNKSTNYTRNGTLDKPVNLRTLRKTKIHIYGRISELFITQMQKFSLEQFEQFDNFAPDDERETSCSLSECKSNLELDSKSDKHKSTWFSDSNAYYQWFSRLVDIDKIKAIKQANTLNFNTKVNITKINGQQKVIFDFPDVFWSNENLKVGQELELESNELNISCYIVKIIGNTITATPGQMISDELDVVKDVEVTGLYSRRVYELLESGLEYCEKTKSPLMSALIQGNKSEIQKPQGWIQQEIKELKGKYKQLNKSQIYSIITSLQTRVSVIQGPPGTGKTEVAACLISRLCAEKNLKYERKILVCCPSNEAVDNLAYRIFDKDDKIKVMRVVAQSRQIQYDSYPAKYQSIILHKVKNQRFSDEEELVEEAQVICTTCTNANDRLFKYLSFDVVIIDECNQAIEPACLLPLMKGAQQLILLGDHKQLAPVVKSKARHMGYKRSLFERIINAPNSFQNNNISMLSLQYRMHPEISKIASKIFYYNKLKDGVGANQRTPCRNFGWKKNATPIMFYNMMGTERQAHNGNSFYNKSEAAQVLILYNFLIKAGVSPKDIGVITPFTSQVILIDGVINNPEVLVNTAHAFQGKEREYIIMSCVRNSPKLSKETEEGTFSQESKNSLFGHIADWNLINVSITRARRGLLIVGNKQQLEKIPKWKQVLEYFQSDKAQLIETPPCEELDLRNATTEMKTIIQKYYP